MYSTTSNTPIPIILTTEYFQKAALLQSLSKNKEIGRQKYLNTLAIYAINYYLGCLDIETDLENSELFKTSLFDFDKANLQLSDLGINIECRPVLPGDKTCILPPETWNDCLGYFAVEIDESSKRATILGFYPVANPDEMLEEISLDNFLSVNYFFDYKEKIDSSFQELVYILKQEIQDRDLLVQILNQDNKRNLLECCLQSRFAEEEDIVKEIINRNLGLETIKKKSMAMSSSTRSSSQADKSFRIEDIVEDFFEYMQDIWQGFETTNNHDLEGNISNQTVSKFSIIDSLKIVADQGIDAANQKLDELAEQVNLLWVDLQPIGATRSLKGKTPQVSSKEALRIDGEQYELIIKPIDVDLIDLDRKNEWTFELRIVEQGGTIPPGYKLQLLDQNGDYLSEREAIGGETALLFENVEFESGDGIILEIEPTPDNYCQKIIYFDSLIP